MSTEMPPGEAMSLISANQGDNKILFRVFAKGLKECLESMVHLTYASRFGRRSKELVSLMITFENSKFELAMERDRLVATISTSSGGVRIRNERVAVEKWVREFNDELSKQAASSEAARRTLEQLAMGD